MLSAIAGPAAGPENRTIPCVLVWRHTSLVQHNIVCTHASHSTQCSLATCSTSTVTECSGIHSTPARTCITSIMQRHGCLATALSCRLRAHASTHMQCSLAAASTFAPARHRECSQTYCKLTHLPLLPRCELAIDSPKMCKTSCQCHEMGSRGGRRAHV